MTTLTKPTARAASTALALEHASDLAVSADRAIKRMCDIVAALIGIILLTPLWFVVALVVRLNDGGPAFFTQERVGLDGRTFTMFKFRTMRVDAEALKASLQEANEADASAGNSIMFKIANDPRITRVGAFLRKTSIDELPQLFNVLRGDMSLVGPRPPLPSEVAQYEPRVMGKFAVRPGITGLWQISGRSNLSWDETVHLDLSYAQHRSLTLDAWILRVCDDGWGPSQRLGPHPCLDLRLSLQHIRLVGEGEPSDIKLEPTVRPPTADKQSCREPIVLLRPPAPDRQSARWLPSA